MSPHSNRPENSASPTRRWLVLAPALVMPFAASFLYFAWFSGTVFGNASYWGIKCFEVFWPLLATVFILKVTLRREPPDAGKRKRSIIIGCLFGLAVTALMLSLKEFTPLGDILTASRERVRERVNGLWFLNHYFLAAIGISVAHAALEEWYWRWFVFGNLRKVVSLPWAHAIAAVGFTAHHVVITSQFFPIGFAVFLSTCVGIGGAFWSWQYQRHRTLLGPWMSHMIVDFAIFYIGYRLLFTGS